MLNSGIRIQRLEKILFIIQPMTALNLTLLPLSWAMMTLRCRQRNGFIMNKNVSWPFLLNHKCNYQLGKSLITNKMETHHCVLCIGVYSKYLSPPLFFFGLTNSMQKLLGQELNLRHCSDLSYNRLSHTGTSCFLFN